MEFHHLPGAVDMPWRALTGLLAQAEPPAAHPPPVPSRLFVWMVSPSLMTKTALYRLSKGLALAAGSNSGGAVVAQGAPAEHPRVTRALPGKALMPGSEGGSWSLSLARDSEMPSDSVGAT